VVQRSLLGITKDPPFTFFPHGEETISGTEDKIPNITKDDPIAQVTWEIPRILGALRQELWMKTKIQIS